MDQGHKGRSSASPSFKMLPRHNSKSNSVGELSSLLSREQKLEDSVRRHSSHGMHSDEKALVARGSRTLSLQSSCHHGSAPSISSKPFLHESLSEGSLPRKECVQNISLNEAATIPFGLLYELAEKLNPLGHKTLNQLALLIGMTQEHFDKLYEAAINPAISLLTEGERFLKSLENLKVALVILELTDAVDLIQKYQLESSRKGTSSTLSPQTSTRTLPTDSDTDSMSDENIETPVFTLGDKSADSVDESKSGRVEGTDRTVVQGDGEGHDRSMLHMPYDPVAPDCTVALQQSFPQHKLETKPIEYEPHSSSLCSKTSPREMFLPVPCLSAETIQTVRSDGSQVDSGFGSAEHSALSSASSSTAFSARDYVDGTKGSALSSESFTSNGDVFCASGWIDEAGDVLYIPNSSISLLVPAGALKRPEIIKLTVTTDPTVKGCPQSANHPRLTPLVSCEPDGLEFLKAAELTLPHCGIIPDPKETVEVYIRSGKEGEDRKWKRDEYASRNAVLKLNTCSIPITHFCDFDVFVRNKGGNIIGKKMRTFPMANCLEHSSDDILLSLWMCNDYNQEYNAVAKEKQDLVTKILLDDYNCYMLEASEKSVNVSYRNRSDMWTLENYQEAIGYNQLWYGSKAKATFRMKCNTSTGGGKLNGTLTVKQEEHCERTKFELQHQVRDLLRQQVMQKKELHQMEPLNLQTQRSYVSQCSALSVKSPSSLTEQGATSLLAMVTRNDDEIYIPPNMPHENHLHIHIPSSSREHSNHIFPQSPPTFQVPYDLAIQLSRHLNGDDVLDNDWRLLSSDLGYSALEIAAFERSKNPTKDVLQDACKKGRLENFDQLRTLLINRERMDAVNTLDQYFKRKEIDPRQIAIEGPRSGFDTENATTPELSRQCSGRFSISTDEPLADGPSRSDSAMIVQPLPVVQGTDVVSSAYQQPDMQHQSGISGQLDDHLIAIPTPPESLCETGTCSLPSDCRTSTPRRQSSTTQEGETGHKSMKYVNGHQNDSGIDSPDTSRPQSRRRIARIIILAPSFSESAKGGEASEPNDSGPVSLASESTPANTHKGIASQSSSDDSGLAESPSSEELVLSPPLDKLNKDFP